MSTAKTKAPKIETDVRMIPHNQIFADHSKNLMRPVIDKEHIKGLANSIKQHGLLEPVGVILRPQGAPGADKQPWEVDYGWSRHEALRVLGYTTDPVPCVVRDHGTNGKSTFLRFGDQHEENTQRREVKYLDRAVMVCRLIEGDYPVEEGQEAKPWMKDDVTKHFGLEINEVNRLLRVARQIPEDIQEVARKAEATTQLLIQMSAVKGEGDTEEQRIASANEQQLLILKKFCDQREALKLLGRERQPRQVKLDKKGKKSKKAKVVEAKPVVSGEKKVPHAMHRDEADKPYSIDDYIFALENKQRRLAAERSAKSREECHIAKGIEIGLRFARGDLKRLPINKQDFEVIAKVADAEAAE